MTIFDAAMIADGCPELAGIAEADLTEETVIEAWQLLIDTGTCWTLQGRIGRTAANLIEQGVCSPAGGKT